MNKFLYLPMSLLLIGRLYAQGGPPMITDDAQTPGNNNLEVNIAYIGENRDSSFRYELPIIDINYGVGDTVQLKIESSYIHLKDDTDIHNNGIGNTTIGLKWRFYENPSNDLLISTYPQYTFVPVRKSYNTGVADINKAIFLPIEISKKLKEFSLTGECGYLSIKNARDEIEYGIVGGYEGLEHLEFLAELHNTSYAGGGNNTLIANAGFKYLLSPTYTFLFSTGHELITPELSKATLFYMGLQLHY